MKAQQDETQQRARNKTICITFMREAVATYHVEVRGMSGDCRMIYKRLAANEAG